MEKLKEKYELDQTVNGIGLMQFMANLLESNEKKDIEVERGKLSVNILKQMNNRSKLIIDAQRVELKLKDFQLKNPQLTTE